MAKTHFRRRRGLWLASALIGQAIAADGALAQQGAPAPDAAQAPRSEEIVVTGSRIRRPDYATASPTVSLDAGLLRQSGSTNVTDFLVSLPALVGSSTSAANSGDRANIGTTGLNLLNLRNLGTNRTLVLVDGRRHVSGLVGTQSVDINTIPEDLIERVDVLTGGASAIYGADGVTGVVNFVLKKNFSGVTAHAQAGISRYGDAGNRLVAITAGHNFADGRGNIALAYEYGDADRLDSHLRASLTGTRAVRFFRNPNYVAGQAGSYYYIPQAGISYGQTSRRGAVDVNFDGLPDFVGTGAVYNNGNTIPGGYTQGSDDTLVSDYGNDLLPDEKRHVANLIAHFDVSPKLTLFAEGKYANTRSFSLAQPTFDYNIFIAQDNPYIPAAIAAAIDPANGGVLVTRDNFDLGQRGESIKRETYRTVAGARGDLNPALHYEISYVFGRTNVTNHFVNDQYSDRFFAAVDAVIDPATGKITCRANLDPNWAPNQISGVYSGRTVLPRTTFQPGQCSPINLFGEGQSSQAGLDFIHASTTEHSHLVQHVVNAALSGDTRNLFELPGGPVGFALGAEYRKEISRFDPDPLEQKGLTYSNLLLPEGGSFTVKEAFGELDLPLLKNKPLFELLDLSGALRIAEYSTIGTHATWKVDLNWAPVHDVRLRGTLSNAVRAPNIGELFGAKSQTYAFFDDPCVTGNRGLGTATRAANCQAALAQAGLTPAQIAAFQDTRSVNVAGTSGGNTALAPEQARTWTAGVVLQPRFVRGLSLSLDWYDIRLKQAINTVDPQKLAELCVDQPTLNNQYCPGITRQTGTGLITGFSVSPQNVAAFHTAGLDLNLDYRFTLARIGQFQAKVVGSYLDKLTFVDSPGATPRDDLGTTYSPMFQAYASLTFATGPLTLNYSLSWWDKTLRYDKRKLAGNPNYVAPQYAWFKQRWDHNLYASLAVEKNFQFYGGVSNLFDQQPDLGSSGYPIDFTGRSFYVGARVTF